MDISDEPKIVVHTRQKKYNTWTFERYRESKRFTNDEGNSVLETGTGYTLLDTGLRCELCHSTLDGDDFTFWNVVHEPTNRRIELFEDLRQAQEFSEWMLNFSPVEVWLSRETDNNTQRVRFEAFSRAHMALMHHYGAIVTEDGEMILAAPKLISIQEPHA